MKKVIFILLHTFLLIAFASAQVDVLMKRYSELRKEQLDLSSNNVLTQSILESINWYYPPYLVCDGNISITFYNTHFVIQAMHNGEIMYGNYTVKNDVIYCVPINIFPNSKDTLRFISLNEESFELKYANDNEDFWYPIKLIHSNGKTVFYAIGKVSNDNFVYKINGYDVFKYDGEVAEVVGNLNVRINPSLSSEKKYMLQNGNKIKIWGRSQKKEIIDGKAAYWYFVDYAYEEGYCPVFGWVFGGYLNITN